jgi:hypothetical protein
VPSLDVATEQRDGQLHQLIGLAGQPTQAARQLLVERRQDALAPQALEQRP